MGGVGNSAQLHKQRLATWFEARAYLDRRFNLIRQRGYLRRAGKPCQQYWWCRVVNEQWQIARKHLKAVLCPQKPRKHEYRPVNTVNPERKVRVPRSISWRRKNEAKGGLGRIGKLHKNRSRRSHEKTGKPKGRPKLDPEEKKKHAARSARKKAFKRKLKKPPKRKYPGDRKRKSQPKSRAKKRVSTGVSAARKQVKPKNKDRRHNHDTKYAYLPPRFRFRKKKGHSKKPGLRVRQYARGKKPGNARAKLILTARRILMAVRKRLRLRAYWKKVHEVAAGR